MIRYALRCERGHAFDSWFADSGSYDRLAKRRQVTCPDCGSAKVDKALMAPRLSPKTRRGKSIAAPADEAVPALPVPAEAPQNLMLAQERELRTKLKALRDHIKANASDVGAAFPEEARKMHYGETEHRPIYGAASAEEARDLVEEGIGVLPLPILPDDRN